MGLTTLCYIEDENRYLMLHRIKKKHDINKDKWIGIGGHFEADESPDECLAREVMEETGCTLQEAKLRGIVTFVSGNGVTEYMFLYTAKGLQGDLIECNEGVLEWVNKGEIGHLNLWEGDRIFFYLLDTRKDFFSLKLVYDGGDQLVSVQLDGETLNLEDIIATAREHYPPAEA